MATLEQIENRRLWIQELRSGLYEQGHACLYRIDYDNHGKREFCCLGVAETVFGGMFQLFKTIQKHGTRTTFISSETHEALGFTQKLIGTLAGLNDCGGTFTEIADLIQDHLYDETDEKLQQAIGKKITEVVGRVLPFVK